jgi:outer membrane lipoprotein SlyB
MQRKIMQVACLAVGLAVAGCAGMQTVEMSEAQRGQIKNIRVLADSKMPEDMQFHGTTQAVTGVLVGGAVGAIIGHAAAAEPKARIIATMKNSNIDLPTIVKSEFQKAAQSRPELKMAKDNSPATAELTLAVTFYGLTLKPGLSGVLYPALGVTATLRKPDGQVIWQKYEYLTALNEGNTGGHELDAYLANPELLRKTFTNIAAIVTRQLVADLSPAT